MFQTSGQTKIKRIMTFRDSAPTDGDSMPCGACLDFLLQLNRENKKTQFLVDYKEKQTTTLSDLLPKWWGETKIEDLPSDKSST